MTAATQHIYRVTIRIDLDDHHRSVDIALPASSTLTELVPELLTMCDIDEQVNLVEFTTVAGAVLHAHAPLHGLHLRDGDIIVMRSKSQVATPIVRDAAESLAARAHGEASTKGLDSLASVGGLIAAGVALAAVLPIPLALANIAALSALLAIFTRRQALSMTAIIAGGLSAGIFVNDGSLEESSLSWGLLAGIGTVLVLLLGAVFAGLASPRSTSAVVAGAVVLGSGIVGLWLPGDAAPGAVSILIALLIVTAAPGIGTRISGLKIPRVPTAGEELPDANDQQADVDERAEQAKLIADGLILGLAIGMIPAYLILAWQGGPWPWALLMCTAGALAVHGSRHHFPVPRVALSAMVLLSMIAGAGALARSESHPVLTAISIALFAIAVTCPLWARFVEELEPTTVVWFERAEQAAIIAVIPLAMHVAGLFSLIRGLG